MRKGEASVKKLTKRERECKKYITKVEDTILKKDEKLKFLEMFKKNSEICSQVESVAPRNDLNELENFGMITQPSSTATRNTRAKNMLHSDAVGDELEPEHDQAAQVEYDDYDANQAGPNGMSDLPEDFGNEGLNIEGLDNPVNDYNDLGQNYDDLGEFRDNDAYQPYAGDDAMQFAGEVQSPGLINNEVQEQLPNMDDLNMNEWVPNDLEGQDAQNELGHGQPTGVVQMVEQETQTDDPREAAAEIQTQTEDVINKEAIT